MNNVLLRSLTGGVFISIILLPLFFSDIATTIVFGLFMAIGLIEFYQLFKHVDTVDVRWETGLFYGLFIFGLASLIFFNIIPLFTIVSLIPLLFSLVLLELWRKKENPIINASVLVFGIFYVAIPFILMVFITVEDKNTFPLLAGMFILTWMNDTFAYLSGRIAGKTKLFERISPNKTWEGTIGGVIFTVLAGVAVGYLFDPSHILFWVVSAVIIAPCAILGDLVESLFKRNVKVKDTGNIMPGHGGILDRFDATFFVVPFFLAWAFIYANL